MTSIDIIEEVKQNFIDSSYDVNTNRAFPDVRDGYKPGQRCILWDMYLKKYTHDKPHVKSAKIDGSVAALYWPHGTQAIYETFVRMSQPFTQNITDVEFHGANGNIILGADSFAADRYCLTGEAKIITSYGIMPIQSVQQYVEEDGETLPEDFLIQDYKGDFVHADKLFNSGIHPVKEVALQNGQSVRGTNNHPIIVLSGGGLGWKRIDQLDTFDKVAVPVFTPKAEIKTGKNDGPLEAKMLGSMISEGCITTQNRLGVTNRDIDLVTPVKDFLQSQGIGLHASIRYRESDKTYNFYTSSGDHFYNFIKKYNYKYKANEKVAPQIVFCEDEQYKSAFLRYLFEGDGSVHLNEKKQETRISYSTCSLQLAKDVQILLLSLGIFCCINSFVRKDREQTEYKVYISGYDIILFEKYVNFVSDRKRNKLHRCAQIQNIKNTVSKNSYRYCPEISNLIQRKMPKDKQGVGYGDLYSIWKAQPGLDSYTFSRLQTILTDYVFVPITGIEEKQKETVYSVRVMEPDSDHSYIANGIINHNTECRLAKITEDYVLKGIEKKSVPMTLNFSEDEYMPTVMPSVFPRLLVNGAQGIGVSVANTWLPHNITETIKLIGKYVKSGRLDAEEYYPDFPTGGTIINKNELSIINKTGKGKVILRANYEIDGKEIIFYEMPYQVYIEPVIEKIKEQIDKEELTGICGVYNKSDKNQIALVVECTAKSKVDNVVEQLFQQTPLQSQYNANQNGIISKTPVLLNLQQTIDVYVKHNLECIKNENKFDLDAANERIEILEGLNSALADIDLVISCIKNSKNGVAAKKLLVSKLKLNERQAKAILDMKLSRLTKLDEAAIGSELEEKKKLAKSCALVVESEEEQKKIFLSRLRKMGKEYKMERRTEVIQKEVEKMKPQAETENLVITFNPLGYLQSIPEENYKDNGLKAYRMTSDDYILLFSDKGKAYRISSKDIKKCGTKDKGTAIGTVLDLANDEYIIRICGKDNQRLLYTSPNGMVKRIDTEQFYGTTRNKRGMLVSKQEEDCAVSECPDDCIITLYSKSKQISFRAESVRPSGKGSGGICGMSLDKGDTIEYIEIENENQFDGKIQKRGGKGIKRIS